VTNSLIQTFGHVYLSLSHYHHSIAQHLDLNSDIERLTSFSYISPYDSPYKMQGTYRNTMALIVH